MKIILLILGLVYLLNAVDLPMPTQAEVDISSEVKDPKNANNKAIKVFGSNLFNGEFSRNSQHRYNPEYLLNISDTINLKLWGAVDLEIKLTIDEQGNIFVPKVGTISLLGVKNKDLSQVIKQVLKQTYKDNVYIYANLDNFQPVSVFISGGAVKPGLYEGLSSDSILQFIDKAKGIDKNGSYRNITVIRNDKVISYIDLYEYLLNGKLDMLQFKTGDIVNIAYLKGFVTIEGDVERPLQIETDTFLSIDTISKLVQPYKEATDIIVTNFNTLNEKKLQMYSIINDRNFKITPNQNIKFVSNNNSKEIEIKIEGEHQGLTNIVVKKGTTLQELISQINFSEQSAKESINLYRKSVAELQKQLLDSSLNELESSVLKTGSSTSEESTIRKEESTLVLDFIKRAKEVELKGRVVLNKDSDLSKMVLEDQDTIYIPKNNHLVTIQGEVKIPSALSYVDEMHLEDYLALCGGLNTRADEENILIIQQNGNVITYDDSMFSNKNITMRPGDSVLVLGKPDSKNIPIVKDLTQIIYQIAVGAAVAIKAF